MKTPASSSGHLEVKMLFIGADVAEGYFAVWQNPQDQIKQVRLAADFLLRLAGDLEQKLQTATAKGK